MKSSLTTKLAALVATLSLASTVFAATPPGGPSQRASNLLSQFHDNAFKVRNWADQLQGYDRAPTMVSWKLDADALDSMRSRINRMDQILDRLRKIEGKLPRNQRAEINQIAPAMVELTDTTQTAIQFMNKHEDLIFMPKYTSYLDEMYSEANRVERASVMPRARAFASPRVNQSTGTWNLGSSS